MSQLTALPSTGYSEPTERDPRTNSPIGAKAADALVDYLERGRPIWRYKGEILRPFSSTATEQGSLNALFRSW